MTAKEIFEKSLHRDEGKTSPCENWVAVYQGKRIQLKNGKCLWARVNHVKCALTHAFETEFYWSAELRALSWDEKKKLVSEFKAWREQAITIIRLEEWAKSSEHM